MDTSSNDTQPILNEQKTVDTPDDNDSINIYPIFRHVFLTLCILLAMSIILFLIYQNGKSIYDKGL